MTIERLIPQEVEAAYFPDGVDAVGAVGNGKINTTMWVERDGARYIVQRVGTQFADHAEAMAEDYAVIADHLAKDGWEMPMPLPTTEGDLTYTDSAKGVWRASEFLPSDEGQVAITELNSLAIYGVMLGKLHRSLRKLDYDPKYNIATEEHFHDTAYFAELLEASFNDIPTEDGKVLARKALDAYHGLPPMPEDDEQILHGDPRTGNMLHRDRVPFTFIDWDTIMTGPPLIDLGDLLRSVASVSIQAGENVPIAKLLDIAENYRKIAYPEVDVKTFEKTAIDAAKLITVELVMRFVTDYKDDSNDHKGWFDHDKSKFAHRHDQNMGNAKVRWNIYEQLDAYTKQNEQEA